MALSEALETLLKTLPADVQAQQRAILEKVPQLGEGWLRQEDYSKKSQEIQAQKKLYDDTQDWYKRNKPVFDQTRKDFEEAQQRVTALEAEVQAKATEAAAAKAAAGEGTGDPQAVAKAVLESLKGQIPTQAELGKMIEAQTEKSAAAARATFFKDDVPLALAFQTAMNDIQFRYRDDFGKPLNRAEFAKFMTEHKISDPIDAYEKYTESDLRKRQVEAEVAKRVKEEHEKAGFVPGSSGTQEIGHLQVRMSDKKAGDTLFGQDVELGDNASAMAAAAELRTEGRL